MATYKPAYRLRVYAPRSVDPTEATVLTPAAGAPHSDPFQVASIAGVAGYKPYLNDRPRGDRGSIDPLSKAVTTGALEAELLDIRLTVGGDNLTRWLSAFFGDLQGRNQLLGLRFEMDERDLFDSVTWNRFATGRVDLTRLGTRIKTVLALRDMRDDLVDAPIFVGRPHSSISYIATPQAWPVGLSAAYGALPASPPLTGTIQSASDLLGTSEHSILIDSASLASKNNLYTKALSQVAGAYSFGSIGSQQIHLLPGVAVYSDKARIKLKRLDTLATGEFKLGPVKRVGIHLSTLGAAAVARNAVQEILLSPVAATDPNFLALPPNGTAVEVRILITADKPSPAAPMLITDVHRGQLWKDLLDGKFGILKPDGSVLQAFGYDSTAFTTLIADTSLPKERFYITGGAKLADWMEKNVCQPDLSYYLDAQGHVVPVDFRRPTSLGGLITVTDADLFEGETPAWSQDRASAITRVEASFYVDRVFAPDGAELEISQDVPVPAALIQPEQQTFIIADFGRSDLGQKVFTLDLQGFRVMPGEVQEGQNRLLWLLGRIQSALEELRNPFGSGVAAATLPCRRTANTKDWWPGQWRLVAVSALPDPGSNKRGGTRLMRCTRRVEDGPRIRFETQDAGPNTIANAPTLGSFTTDPADVRHGVSIPVTLNAQSEPVVVEIAVTAIGGSVPGATASAWTFAARVTTSQTVVVPNLPAGMRIWRRARSEPGATHNAKLPSSWAGNDSLDLGVLTAPNTLAVGTLSGRRAVATWVNGESALPIEIWLSEPSSDPVALIRTLPAGSTSFELLGLTPSTTHTISIRHNDGRAGVSAYATTTFSTTATPLVAPDPGGIAILMGAA